MHLKVHHKGHMPRQPLCIFFFTLSISLYTHLTQNPGGTKNGIVGVTQRGKAAALDSD